MLLACRAILTLDADGPTSVLDGLSITAIDDPANYAAVSKDLAFLDQADDDVAAIHGQSIWWGDMPGWAKREQQEFLEFLDRDQATWAFWKRWYLARFEGRWDRWDLSKGVSEIARQVWDAGPNAVAQAIGVIERKACAGVGTVGERPDSCESRGSHDFVLDIGHDQSVLDRALKQVQFAADVALASNASGFHRLSTAFQYIQFAIDQCTGDANAVEQSLELAWDDIADGVADQTYQNDSALRALLKQLERSIDDLRANHGDVRDARARRARLKLSTLEQETLQQVAEREKVVKTADADRLIAEIELEAKAALSGSGLGGKDGARRARRRRSWKI
ncbi:MAG: hypothetical protein AAGF71_04050 [Pseudomonadota bacterium]